MEAWRRAVFGTQGQYQPVEEQEVDNKLISGLGALYKAYDLEQQCLVAIHVVDEHLATDATFRQNFAECLARSRDLEDVNLLRILDYKREDKRCYVITNWVEGLTLHELLKDLANTQQRPGILDVIEIVQQVGGALETLYLNNQWTRAINLKTVKLIRQDDNRYAALLTDLGLVGLAGEGIKRSDYWGQDFALLAPERFVARKPYTEHEFDPTADVYALGVLFYQLLLGKLPFEITKIEEGEECFKLDLDNPQTEIRPLPPRLHSPDFPQALERVLLKALTVRPEKRYPSARDLMVDLARALALDSGGHRDVLRRQWVSLIKKLSYPAALTEADESATGPNIISVDKPRLKVVPGGTETINIMVANPTTRVDHFVVTGGRLPTDWYTITSLNDGRAAIGQEARFLLAVHPPQGLQQLAGDYPLELHAQSKLHPNAPGVTYQLTLTVDRVVAYQIEEINPQVICGRDKAVIGVKNLGNSRETFRFTWRSEENSVTFQPPSALVIVDPWQTAPVEFCPSPRYTPWFGKGYIHKISTQVDVLKAGKLEIRKAEVHTTGTISWLALVLGTIAAAVLGLLLLVMLLQPSITPAAKACEALPIASSGQAALTVCLESYLLKGGGGWVADRAASRSARLALADAAAHLWPTCKIAGPAAQ